MSSFKFKQFEIQQDKCAMKIGTDGVLLGAWADIAQASSILDIGTGTGVLAIMAAQRNPRASIDAVEIDKNAFEQASANIFNSPWAKRLSCHLKSIQNFCSTKQQEQYDSIISNPPYFNSKASTTILDPSRNQARSTEKLPFLELLSSVQYLLHPQGNFTLILPTQEGNAFIELAKTFHFHLKKYCQVYPRIGKPANRLLIELVKYPSNTIYSDLAIREGGKGQQDYTLAYTSLHQAFYLFC